MPQNCQVPNCNLENDGEIVYHLFPTNEQLKQRWLKAIGRPNFNPTSTSLICSKHFEETDFTYRFGKKTLRNAVVPSVFNNKLEPKVQKSPPKEVKSPPEKYLFYIPHYILVDRKHLGPDGSLNLENLNPEDLSPPILYGIGNTSTVIDSPDVVTSHSLKPKKKVNVTQRNEDNVRSNAIKELTEIHSYNKKAEESPQGPTPPEEVEDVDMDVVEKETILKGGSDLQMEGTSLGSIMRKPGGFFERLPGTSRDPSLAKIAWNKIHRTLELQQKKIQSLQAEHTTLQKQFNRLKENIKEIKERKRVATFKENYAAL